MANIGINITENGTTTLATAGKYCDRNIDVNVAVGSVPAVIQALEVTTNGTYNAPEGVDGYAPVTVNVPQDGAPPDALFTFSSDLRYLFAYNHLINFFDYYPNKLKFMNAINLSYMFYGSNSISKLPVTLTIPGSGNSSYMFQQCINLTEVPDIRGFTFKQIDNMFNQCYKLREIPDSFVDNNDWTTHLTSTNSSAVRYSNLFNSCYSLRKISKKLFEIMNQYVSNSYSIYYSGFYGCHSLDELTDLPCYDKATWTANAFFGTFGDCGRLARIVFKTNDDGTPIKVKWKAQNLLVNGIGYTTPANQRYILNFNSGITADKEVTDDASYQALKNDPDWWTKKIEYSRYNHTSAVETLNSLPDTSEYLTTAGGTNIIKFTGAAGSKTDGGAINTLTEAEIAVAAAKGWTVSLD